MHVLICLAQSPDLSLRDVAVKVGITERAVQRIIKELEEEDYLSRRKVGRQNKYTLNLDAPLRHELEANYSVGKALKVFFDTE